MGQFLFYGSLSFLVPKLCLGTHSTGEGKQEPSFGMFRSQTACPAAAGEFGNKCYFTLCLHDY